MKRTEEKKLIKQEEKISNAKIATQEGKERKLKRKQGRSMK